MNKQELKDIILKCIEIANKNYYDGFYNDVPDPNGKYYVREPLKIGDYHFGGCGIPGMGVFDAKEFHLNGVIFYISVLGSDIVFHPETFTEEQRDEVWGFGNPWQCGWLQDNFDDIIEVFEELQQECK